MLKWLAIYLAGLGCQPACQAAVIGHFQVESGTKPCIDQNGFLGMAQLGFERRRRYLAWAGKRWCDAETQMRWYIMEMRQMGIWHSLTNTKSVEYASRLMDQFEQGVGSALRLQHAEAVFKKLPKPAIVFSCASC